MSLTDFVQHLRRISIAENLERRMAGAYQQLHDGLRSLWAGKPRHAIDIVTKLLGDEPETDCRFAAYRLWIEALAELNDRASLAILADHLFIRGQAEPDDQEVYVALRGMVDLELDAIQAVRLTVKALRPGIDNPYALELIQLYENRIFARRLQEGDLPALLKSGAPIVDYFHWVQVARALQLTRDDEQLSVEIRDEAAEAMDEVFEHIHEVFRGSPIPSLFAFHRCVQSRNFSAAAVMAHELVRAYPENIDFVYFHAYALFEDGDYPAARQVLNNTLSVTGERDPEILSLLGHCNAKLGDSERARHYLQRSTEILRAEGLPHSHTYLELSDVEEDLRKGRPDPRYVTRNERAYWLIELSPRRYHEMLTSTDESLAKLIRPMGIGAKPGDVAFFATKIRNKDGSKAWKIIADYTVDSTPIWHPTQGYHTSLKLDSRYEVGIVVPELKVLGPGKTIQEQGYHALHKKFGVFELDQRGIAQIAESLQEHFAEHFTERRVDGGRTRSDVG